MIQTAQRPQAPFASAYRVDDDSMDSFAFRPANRGEYASNSARTAPSMRSEGPRRHCYQSVPVRGPMRMSVEPDFNGTQSPRRTVDGMVHGCFYPPNRPNEALQRQGHFDPMTQYSCRRSSYTCETILHPQARQIPRPTIMLSSPSVRNRHVPLHPNDTVGLPYTRTFFPQLPNMRSPHRVPDMRLPHQASPTHDMARNPATLTPRAAPTMSRQGSFETVVHSRNGRGYYNNRNPPVHRNYCATLSPPLPAEPASGRVPGMSTLGQSAIGSTHRSRVHRVASQDTSLSGSILEASNIEAPLQSRRVPVAPSALKKQATIDGATRFRRGFTLRPKRQAVGQDDPTVISSGQTEDVDDSISVATIKLGWKRLNDDNVTTWAKGDTKRGECRSKKSFV